MREIKFRARDIKTNKWVYGGYYKHLTRTPCPIGDRVKECDYEHLIINSGFSDWNMPKPLNCYRVDGNTVCQYTGRKESRNLIGEYDKKEIYEGDILQEDGWDDLYVVVFEDCKFIAESKHTPNGDLFKRYDKDLGDMLFPIVVGNIYENSDMLIK